MFKMGYEASSCLQFLRMPELRNRLREVGLCDIRSRLWTKLTRLSLLCLMCCIEVICRQDF